VAPFFINNNQVVHFFISKLAPKSDYHCYTTGKHRPDFDSKLAPDIIDKYIRAPVSLHKPKNRLFFGQNSGVPFSDRLRALLSSGTLADTSIGEVLSDLPRLRLTGHSAGISPLDKQDGIFVLPLGATTGDV
jgi:hypothetical protein